jgi:hypothetical protein
MTTTINYPLPQPTALKVAAKVLSYIFHPLFIPTYVSAYLIFSYPYSFSSFAENQKMMKLLSLFIITAGFPAITVFLLWRLQFAQSIFLRTQKERIIPYVASTIYFFWAWYVSRNQPSNPPTLVFFLLGLFLSTSAALMANNYFKISMHALGIGGGVAFMVLLGISGTAQIGLPISIATLIGGLVCTARFIISDHFPGDIYSGLFLGALCQVVAWWVVM